MDNYFKYAFDDSTLILYKYYFGTIRIEDIYASWDYAIKENIIPEVTAGFIVDYRGATFDINLKEYHKISDYYKNHLEIFGGKKIAIITESPKDIIIPTLVEANDYHYMSRPFSTLKAAIAWVLS